MQQKMRMTNSIAREVLEGFVEFKGYLGFSKSMSHEEFARALAKNVAPGSTIGDRAEACRFMRDTASLIEKIQVK